MRATRRHALGGLVSALGVAPFLFSQQLRVSAQEVGSFVGELKFRPVTKNGTVGFELLENYGYLDPMGRMWQARAGLFTDGASIPSIFWPFIGNPYGGLYLNAAIIHDFYCIPDNRYRYWQDVHHVFYDAMLTNGVNASKAKLMFFAVWRFGPRWDITELRSCTPTPTNFCASVTPKGYQISSRNVIQYDPEREVKTLLLIQNETDLSNYSISDLIDKESSLPPLLRDLSILEIEASTRQGWFFRHPYRIPLIGPGPANN